MGETRFITPGDIGVASIVVSPFQTQISGEMLVFGPTDFRGAVTAVGDLQVSGSLVAYNSLTIRSGPLAAVVSASTFSAIGATLTAPLATATLSSATGSLRISQGGDVQVSGTQVMSYGALSLPRLTSAQRDALTVPDGTMVYVMTLPVSGIHARIAGNWQAL